MSVEAAPVGILAIAVAGGLLAVFGVWVWGRIADEKTRSQGIAAAALVAGVVVLGIFFTSARDVVRSPAATTLVPEFRSSPVPASADFSARIDSSVTIDNGPVEIHAGSNVPLPVSYQASPPAGFAPRWSILSIVAGAIVLVIVAKRSLGAALAGLVIIAGLLLMYALQGGYVQPTIASSVAPTTPATMPPVQPLNRTTPPSGQAESPADRTTSEAGSGRSQRDGGTTEPERSQSDRSKSAEAAEAPASDKHEGRPSWVEQPAQIDKSTGDYRVAVTSGPYATEYECDYQLDDRIREAVSQYADRHLGPTMKYFAYDRDYAREHLVEERYVETIQSQVLGRPMVQLHALLKIDANDRRFFEARYREAQISKRIQIVGTSAASTVAVLAAAYGALCYAGRRKRTAQDSVQQAQSTG